MFQETSRSIQFNFFNCLINLQQEAEAAYTVTSCLLAIYLSTTGLLTSVGCVSELIASVE